MSQRKGLLNGKGHPTYGQRTYLVQTLCLSSMPSPPLSSRQSQALTHPGILLLWWGNLVCHWGPLWLLLFLGHPASSGPRCGWGSATLTMRPLSQLWTSESPGKKRKGKRTISVSHRESSSCIVCSKLGEGPHELRKKTCLPCDSSFPCLVPWRSSNYCLLLGQDCKRTQLGLTWWFWCVWMNEGYKGGNCK